MKKTFSKKKSAFSLIELSIVLIVIGLLIAGITGGASLIKSSELRSVMGEARGYAVAVNAFYSQFNALPGDYATAVAVGDVLGDGNGQIDHISAADVAEGSQAWLDLKAIGAIDSSLAVVTGASGSTPAQVVNVNIPASKVKSAGWAFNYASSQNVVVLTAGVSAGGTLTAAAAITASDGLSIDAKIDDGVATTGKVRGVLTACLNSTAYATGTAGKICALSYQVDVNS